MARPPGHHRARARPEHLSSPTPPTLLAVPNFSEGRDGAVIAAVENALSGAVENSLPGGPAPARAYARGPSVGEHMHGDGVRVLDVHSDPDPHRSVYTLAGSPAPLVDAVVRGAGAALASIDVMAAQAPRGEHPHVGALDVAPMVYLHERDRGAACAAALVLADRLAHELALPVFLYGELKGAGAGERATRAHLRRGGVAGLRARMAAGELTPDFGPSAPHASAGAVLVAARPPLVAFNVLLAPPATIADARRVAALIREGGAQGIPGLRAIAVSLSGGRPQVSMNVERPLHTPLAEVMAAIARQAPIATAEIVGLVPAGALAGFPAEIPIAGFHPERQVIERVLRRPGVRPSAAL